MAIRFDVPHKIGAEEARKRLHGQAAGRGVNVEPDGARPSDPMAGEVEHGTPMGDVRVSRNGKAFESVIQKFW